MILNVQARTKSPIFGKVNLGKIFKIRTTDMGASTLIVKMYLANGLAAN